jgi:hypothetical protein
MTTTTGTTTMAELSTAERKKLPKSTFGLPGRRGYPMPDRPHAANAKARASQQVGKSISSAQKAEIDAKANRILASKGHEPVGTSLAKDKAKR